MKRGYCLVLQSKELYKPLVRRNKCKTCHPKSMGQALRALRNMRHGR